jgi:hypothetical protein
MSDFVPFTKIPRLSRTVIVTEKIDGTNASIHIGEDGSFRTASRTRWIVPGDDNFGFAGWAYEHKDELMLLGPGAHFGEWWGAGIQRRYDLNEKRFSLFNVGVWGDAYEARCAGHEVTSLPACCHVVPTLLKYDFDSVKIDGVLEDLRQNGSKASPGFMNPEGIIVYHTASRQLFKKTLDKNDAAKGDVAR